MGPSAEVAIVDTAYLVGRRPEMNDRARVATRLGIAAAAFLALAIAMATTGLITALTTPDYMPSGLDDPFLATYLACVVPLLIGCISLGYGIAGIKAVRAHGERVMAIRGLTLGIVNVVFSIATGVVFFNFYALSGGCGGG
jgi:hypothetical protein